MNTRLDFGALPYYIGAIVLVLALQKMLQILKAWWVQRWRVTSGVVKDTMLVPHAELARPVWGRYYSFVGVTQYIAVVNYTFHDGGIDRDGSLQQRFSIERAAHKFLTHFHTGQTVSVRHGSIWPHLSTLEFEPTILHEARSIEQPVNRKAACLVLYNPHVGADEKFDMKRTLKLGTVIVLFWSAFAFAQVPASPENRPEPVAPPNPPLGLGKRVPVSTTARYGGIEVTTDTQGVDFGPYLQVIAHQIKQNWYSIIPPTAMAPLFKRGKVVIEFAITKNGQIAGLHYAKGSGDVALDRAAYAGVTLTNPFPPLPSVFPGQYLGLRMSFLYNPRLKGISPSGAQVRAGSSLQFSPVLAGIIPSKDSVVTWSISGEGCTGSECGTISEAGLYTAPLTVPENPHIAVKATASADLDETVSTVVTIVQPEPPQNDGPK